jgi:hypothetical protein
VNWSGPGRTWYYKALPKWGNGEKCTTRQLAIKYGIIDINQAKREMECDLCRANK